MTPSGTFAALTESTGMLGAVASLAKWISLGASSGLAVAVAAVEANPEIAKAAAPDLRTSVIALIGGIIAYALKVYVPSEKKVDEQFKGQTNLLLNILENRAFGPLDKISKDLHDHKTKMAVWAAKTDTRLDNIEKKSTGETPRPKIMTV